MDLWFSDLEVGESYTIFSIMSEFCGINKFAEDCFSNCWPPTSWRKQFASNVYTSSNFELRMMIHSYRLLTPDQMALKFPVRDTFLVTIFRN